MKTNNYNLLKRKAEQLVKKPISFLAPTMAPAAAYKGELESLEWALEYYKAKGQKEVLLQPKYMGSRATLYIHLFDTYSGLLSSPLFSYFQSLETQRQGFSFIYPSENKSSLCYLQTRSGFIIPCRTKGVYEDLWEPICNLVKQLSSSFPGAKKFVVDGELCPWSIFAEKLIDKEFTSTLVVKKAEISSLRNTSFLSKFSNTYDSFIKDEKNNKGETPKEKQKRLGYSTYKTYSNAGAFCSEIESLFQLDSSLRTYSNQLDAFASNYETEFCPFDLLAVDNKLYSSNLYFSSKCRVVQLDNLDTALIQAREYFNFVLRNPYLFTNCPEMEGIVVKPVNYSNFKIAPALKVRSYKYLHLVYGPEILHLSAYHLLCEKKSIVNKLQLSMKETSLSNFLLQLNLENTERRLEVITAFLQKKELEEGLDPRL